MDLQCKSREQGTVAVGQNSCQRKMLAFYISAKHIFDDSSDQFPAIFVAAQSGNCKPDLFLTLTKGFFCAINQTISTSLS